MLFVAGSSILPACRRASKASSISSGQNDQQVQVATQDVPDQPVAELCVTPGPPPVEPQHRQKRFKRFKHTAKTPAQPQLITVVFHVINNGDSPAKGNVSEQQIVEQVQVLNDAFRPLFEFKLDPKIDRYTKLDWYKMEPKSDEETAAMATYGVKDKAVLNVYTAGISVLGWAVPPWEALSASPYRDGVVIHFSTLPHGTHFSHDQGKTLIHEFAHWLGLYHIYEGCFDPGDYVLDTPPEEAEPSSSCPFDRDSCTNDNLGDLADNFMDSIPDTCATHFTTGQFERMWTKFNACRRPGLGPCSPY
jgi:hypothetical protein